MTFANAILTTEQMYASDLAAIKLGIPGEKLMEAAGSAIAREIRKRFSPRRTCILCGPGNNGGDGFVIARILAARGWSIRLGLLGKEENLKGDAALHRARWRGAIHPISDELLTGCELVVDALFGAGLTRPLQGQALSILKRAEALHLPIVAVDLPSGLNGNLGEVNGFVAQSALTVSFFKSKLAHNLYPARSYCGEIVISDILIPETVLLDIAPKLWHNHPELWQDQIPANHPYDHKYSRGHLGIIAGEIMCGASKLAALAARRAGAGMLSLFCKDSSFAIYSSSGEPGNLVKPYQTEPALQKAIEGAKLSSLLVGPGLGRGEASRELVRLCLAQHLPCVLDADALSSFAESPDQLFKLIKTSQQPVVLTPHEGEFTRLFGPLAGSKVVRCQSAAERSGAIVLLKGPDTVVTSPCGKSFICTNGSPKLATAGSGDVLAGIIAGLIAQGMPALHATLAGTWLHGEAAKQGPDGLIAEDLPKSLALVKHQLSNKQSSK